MLATDPNNVGRYTYSMKGCNAMCLSRWHPLQYKAVMRVSVNVPSSVGLGALTSAADLMQTRHIIDVVFQDISLGPQLKLIGQAQVTAVQVRVQHHYGLLPPIARGGRGATCAILFY